MPACWFSSHAEDQCDGRLQRCHLIPKQRIKREMGKLQVKQIVAREVIWHPSVWVWGCERHHARFDQGQIRVTRADMPKATEFYAKTMDLTWSLDADYGVRA